MKAGIYKTTNGNYVYVAKDRTIMATTLNPSSWVGHKVKTSQKEQLISWIGVSAVRVSDVPNGCTDHQAALRVYADAASTDNVIGYTARTMVDVQKERVELSGVSTEEQARSLANYWTSGNVDFLKDDDRRFFVVDGDTLSAAAAIVHTTELSPRWTSRLSLKPDFSYTDKDNYQPPEVARDAYRRAYNQMLHNEYLRYENFLGQMEELGVVERVHDAVYVLDHARFGEHMAEYNRASQEATQRALSAPYGSSVTPADDSPTTTIFVDAGDAQEVRDMVHRHLPHASVHNARLVDMDMATLEARVASTRHFGKSPDSIKVTLEGYELHPQMKKVGITGWLPCGYEATLAKMITDGEAWTCGKQSARKHRKAGHRVVRLGMTDSFVWWKS